MKTFAAVFVGGALGILLLKLVLGLLISLFGWVFGLLALVIKLALLAAGAYFLYVLVFGKRRPREDVA